MESLRAVRDGEVDACEKLWKRYSQRVERLAAGWLKRFAGTISFGEEDVAVSTFAELVSGLESGRFRQLAGSDDLWRLMAVIAIRKARERLRNEQTLKRSGGEGVLTLSLDDSDAGLVATDRAIRPELSAIMVEELGRYLRALNDTELEQVVLMKLDGFGNAEIATEMNYSRSTIQRMLNTVRILWESQVALASH